MGTNKVPLVDLLAEGTTLFYVVKGVRQGRGGIFRDGGIICLCCEKKVSPTQFEQHAGFGTRKNAYKHICTLDGESLELKVSRKLETTLEQKADQCIECYETEDLFPCKNCCRSFHAECVGLSSIPEETWWCAYCASMYEKTKLHLHTTNATEEGETQHSIGFEEGLEYDVIGKCAICSCHDFMPGGFHDRTIIYCDQCEMEYHVGCLRENNIVVLKEAPKEWFCSKPCRNIHSSLSKLVMAREQNLPDDLLYTLKKKIEANCCQDKQFKIQWKLLRGKDVLHKHDPHSKNLLSGALSVFKNQFCPIYDSTTARNDLIKYMVEGGEFRGQSYSGMYCAVLTIKSVVVSTALFRIFGEELAEIPLVATKKGFEGKGYFQSLFFCLEQFMASQNIRNLVIPATKEEESMWKYRFWFDKLTDGQVQEYEDKGYHIMTFDETSVMHKSIPQLERCERSSG